MGERQWLTVSEAAERTGYHQDYIQKLARKNAGLPADQREIVAELTPNGYLIFLPSLLEYKANKSPKSR